MYFVSSLARIICHNHSHTANISFDPFYYLCKYIMNVIKTRFIKEEFKPGAHCRVSFCNSTELVLMQVKLHNRLRHSIVAWLTTVHLITQIKERLYAAGDEGRWGQWGGWGSRCSEAELINRADEHQLYWCQVNAAMQAGFPTQLILPCRLSHLGASGVYNHTVAIQFWWATFHNDQMT